MPEEDPGTDLFSKAFSFSNRAFLEELARAARLGSAALGPHLQRVYGECHRALYGASSSSSASTGSPLGTTLAAERDEKVEDLVAAFLSSARDPDTGETLLGVAAAEGRFEAVEYLLGARADPMATDRHGRTALHAAAEGGAVLPVLLILDRLQGSRRSIRLADVDPDGPGIDRDSPEVLASRAGAAEVCMAFDHFSGLQADAEQRRLGHCRDESPLDQEGGGAAPALAVIDLAADPRSKAGLTASALLRRAVAGTGLVRHIFRRVPESEVELREVIEHVCHGIRCAEERLLSTEWGADDPGLSPALRSFASTADLRSRWQKLRMEATRVAGCSESLAEFWQTHLSAETMVATLARVRGDSFQLLLIVLWLYTREAWLPHIVDALAGMVFMANPWQDCPNADGADGTTGATPLRSLWSSDPSPVVQACSSLVDTLAPCAQLVQSALTYFEERGIRHEGETYRPLLMSVHLVRLLLDRVAAAQGRALGGEEEEGGAGGPGSRASWPWIAGALGGDVWLALGADSFFSSLSSRAEAVQRLLRTRSNVLLVLRPDKLRACFPKHLSLRCSGVDDVLFPLGVLFRVVGVSRAMSSDLVDQAGKPDPPWPVTILELAAADRSLEALEALERRAELRPGELEMRLEEWADGASPAERHVRLLAAGELLARCAGEGGSGLEAGGPADSGGGSASPASSEGGGASAAAGRGGGAAAAAAAAPAGGRGGGRGGGRAGRAAAMLEQAAARAEAMEDGLSHARALLACARFRTSQGGAEQGCAAAEAKRAVVLLEERLGSCHAEVCAARAVWQSLTFESSSDLEGDLGRQHVRGRRWGKIGL